MASCKCRRQGRRSHIANPGEIQAANQELLLAHEERLLDSPEGIFNHVCRTGQGTSPSCPYGCAAEVKALTYEPVFPWNGRQGGGRGGDRGVVTDKELILYGEKMKELLRIRRHGWDTRSSVGQKGQKAEKSICTILVPQRSSGTAPNEPECWLPPSCGNVGIAPHASPPAERAKALPAPAGTEKSPPDLVAVAAARGVAGTVCHLAEDSAATSSQRQVWKEHQIQADELFLDNVQGPVLR
ncbi:hypothetical protein ACJZ2D_010837 [Fusarium nematophilum]